MYHWPLYITELQNADDLYTKKVQQPNHLDKTMFSLAWNVEELKKINDECRKLLIELDCILNLLLETSTDVVKDNISLQLTKLRERLLQNIKSSFWYHRTPATHVAVFMISDERRVHKPYALPIQCVPCTGLKVKDMRRLINEIITEMVKRRMKVSG